MKSFDIFIIVEIVRGCGGVGWALLYGIGKDNSHLPTQNCPCRSHFHFYPLIPSFYPP